MLSAANKKVVQFSASFIVTVCQSEMKSVGSQCKHNLLLYVLLRDFSPNGSLH